MAAAEVLIMPSYYESLSMVALEAWALGKPVLANGRCDVLQGPVPSQQRRPVLRELRGVCRDAVRHHVGPGLSDTLGRNGRTYFRTHYAWPVIERKYLETFDRLGDEPRDGAGARAAAGILRPPAPHAAAGRRRAGRHPGRSGAPMSLRAVHQVLATLGYGDAIGHEVLGIQRVLRAAGYDSEIFVETADTRLEDLTYDYRDLVDASHPDNLLIHHFSIGSRASRVAYALPDRMALVYHNITPPEYFVGVHKQLVELCWKGRRELKAYVDRCDLALGDSEFNRQELDALGFPDTGVLPVVPDFSHLAGTPDWRVAGQFDDERTNILFVGRMIPNKRIENVIRIFHAYRTRFNPRSRLLLVGSHGGFEKYLTMLHQLVATLGTPDVHFSGHVSNEELTAYYDVADLFLCASEHEGFCVPLVEAFHMRVPVVALAATAVPATLDGGGVLYEDRDPHHVAALVDAVLSDQAIADNVLAAQDAALGRLLGQGLRRHAAGLRRPHRRRRRVAARASRGVRLLGSAAAPTSGSKSCGCSARRRSRGCRNDPSQRALPHRC